MGLRRRAAANLLFSLMAVSAAVMAALELSLMHSSSASVHGALLRWAHVPFFLLLVSLVFFVRTYLHAGRLWLAWTIIGVRAASLLLNFLSDPNLNYVRITGVRPLRFLGETIFLTEGVFSERTRIGQLSSLLVLLFLLDATRTVWRRGDRRRAVVVGGSTLIFVFAAMLHTALVMEQAIPSPYLISVAYLGVVAAMAYELTFDVIRSSELARRLQIADAALRESEQRMALAAEAANAVLWHFDVERDEIWMSERGRAIRGYAKRGADRLPPIPGVGPPRGSRGLPCGGRRRAPDGRGVRARIPRGAAERGDALDRGPRPRRGRGARAARARGCGASRST